MFIFICLFFPTMISISLEIKNKNLKLIQLLESYCIYNMLINFSILILIYFSRRPDVVIIDDSLFTASFILKYLVLSCIVAYILPILKKHVILRLLFKVKNYLKKNIRIRVYRKRNGVR